MSKYQTDPRGGWLCRCGRFNYVSVETKSEFESLRSFLNCAQCSRDAAAADYSRPAASTETARNNFTGLSERRAIIGGALAKLVASNAPNPWSLSSRENVLTAGRAIKPPHSDPAATETECQRGGRVKAETAARQQTGGTFGGGLAAGPPPPSVTSVETSPGAAKAALSRARQTAAPVSFAQSNPKRLGSASWARYEAYKRAPTIAAALSLGALGTVFS